MMKFFGTILVFFLCTLSVSGQKNGSLSGILLEKEAGNEAIVAGSIALLNAKDSTFITGTVSDGDGHFAFQNLSAGSYILKITYLGYKIQTKNVRIPADLSPVNAGKIYLEADAILLKETVVEGKKPEVIVKNDTIEFDAGSYKVPENAMVEDLLKKLPGVEVDKDGKITANGKEIKRIMVDGKEFFSDDPQVASKNLPADMVDKLQVVDRKSDMARMTGFDDGEEETVINLMVRPGMKKGTMGNALVGAGADVQDNNDLRYQAAAFINNMKDNDRYTLILGRNNNNNMGAADLGANRFGGMRMRRGGNSGITESTNFMLSLNKELSKTATLNGDVRYNNSDRTSQSKVIRKTTLSELESRLDSTQTRTNYISDNISANFTLEWKPDTSNTLIFRPNIRFNKSHSEENESSSRYNFNTMNRQYSSFSDSRTKGQGLETGGNLDFSHRFNKPGRVFSINARGSYNTSYSWENSRTNYEGATLLPNLNQRAENDDRTSNYRMSVSYVEPIGKNNFLQAFYRISHYNTRSLNSTYDLDVENTDWWATLNDSLSRSTLRRSNEQRIGLNFKAVRAKYNYTVGINYDPVNSTNETYQPDESVSLPYNPDKRLENNQGNVLISSIPLNTPNFSPVVNFNYLFSQRTNLRIDYEGETKQPTANQLKDFTDKSRPTEWTEGNPNLKTGYNNNLRIRYSRYVPETQLMYNINMEGNFPVNDITAVTVRVDSIINKTTYENINGNWNMLLRGMFNLPLRNKRFTVGNFANISYRNQNSFIAQQNTGDDLIEKTKNTLQNFMLMDNANINYRSDLFDMGMNVSVNYNSITYSLQSRDNQHPVSWGLGGYTTWYLPYHLTLESNINYTNRSGYSSGFNTSEVMWNAAITKQLFNKKYGTGSLKLQIFDILQDRNNITSSATTNGWQTSEVTVIPSYFMCSFIYKFTVFPKSSSAKEEDFRPTWGGPPGGGPPPQGPPPGGFRPF